MSPYCISRVGFCLLCYSMCLLVVDRTHAQGASGLSFRGSAGVYGELYSMKGIQTRRPHQTGRVFVRGSILWDGFQLPVDLFFTTEEEVFRQFMQRVSLGFKNNVVELHAGDQYPVYSPLTLQGSLVRGVHGIAKTSGFRVQFNAGQNQRAIDDDPVRGRFGAFRRFVYAGNGGYDAGSIAGQLHVVRIRDEISSIAVSSSYLRPQENLIVGGQLSGILLDRALRLTVELDQSLWTGDMREIPSDSGKVPGVLESFFRERPSTKSGIAFRSEAVWQASGRSLSAKYQRVERDYFSMGSFGFQPDWEDIRFQGSTPLFEQQLMLSLNLGTRSDNLSDTKPATTRRTDASLNAQYRIDEVYRIGGSYSLYFDRNDATGLTAVDMTTHSVTLRPAASWGTADDRDQLDVQLTYHRSNDGIERPGGSYNYTRYGVSSSYSKTFSSDLTLSGSYQYNRNEALFGKLNSHGIILNGNLAIIPTKLTGSLMASITREASDRDLKNTRFFVQVSGRYAVTTSLSVQLNADATLFNTNLGNTYQEFRSGLTVTQQF